MMNIATGTRITLNKTFEILRELTGYKGEPAYASARAGDIRDSLADYSAGRGAAWLSTAGRFPRRAASLH